MQVGAEFPLGCLALHRRNDAVADHKTADVSTTGFFDVFLHHDVGFQAQKGFDHAFGRFARLGQDHTNTLSTFKQFDHQRRAADHVDQVRNIVRAVGKAGHWQADTFARHQLHGAQLVPGAADGHRFVKRVNTHHFKLTQYCRTVESDGGTDTWNHSVEIVAVFPFIVDARRHAVDVHIAVQGIEHFNFMPAEFSGLNQTTR